jgi:alpha-beta hydrolase superfamily lysophospholipase
VVATRRVWLFEAGNGPAAASGPADWVPSDSFGLLTAAQAFNRLLNLRIHRVPSMEHHAGTIRSADGVVLATRSWRPHDHPKAAVLLVHGISEHSGRYAHVAAHLLLHDYAVFSYDHRGHGRSSGEPRGYIERFDTLVEDLRRAVRWVRSEIADVPLFLMGHSLGGAVVARFAINYGTEEFAGIVMSSASLRIPDSTSPFLQRISGTLDRLAPRMPTIRLSHAHRARDVAVGRAFDEDPLCYKGGVRVRTGVQILAMTRDLLENAHAFTGPLYLFHGTSDEITDPGGTQALYEAAPSEDKTLRMYSNSVHELLNDVHRDIVLRDLVEWLDRRVPLPASPDGA